MLHTYCVVNSTVLCEVGVARQRDAEYRDSGLWYGGYINVQSWVYPTWWKLDSDCGMCGRKQLHHVEQYHRQLST